MRVSIGMVVLGPGGLLTSHFGFSSLGFSGVAGDCPIANEPHSTLAIKTRNGKDGRDMSFLLYERKIPDLVIPCHCLGRESSR